jgi:integrase/recombinase XerD
MENDMMHPTSALAPSRTARPADLAAFSYLARYGGATREHYRVVLSVLFRWLDHHGIDPLEANRPILEMFGRHLEEDRRCSQSTVAGYLSVIKGYYKFADIDGHIEKDPAVHIRVPRVYLDESSQVGLDRNEFGALLAAAKVSHVYEWALITLLGCSASESPRRSPCASRISRSTSAATGC